MRIFIAIDLPEEIREEIVKIQNQLEKRDLFKGKFTEKQNLHLTLKFLGELQENEIEKIKERLREIGFSGFEAKLGKIGIFSPRFIKIIWVEILGKVIFSLQKEIDNKLKDLFEKERRFMSHLTIARVKVVKDRKRFLDELNKIKLPGLKFNINKFYLIESELKSEGPEYRILEEFKAK